MAEDVSPAYGVAKCATGIPGFEFISDGGLPQGRATLLSGSSGSGKTAICAQFLVEGVRRYSEGGVFVTFEESPEAIRNNFESLGWPIAEWEAQGKWAFVDLSPDEDQAESAGDFDFGALLPRIEYAINQVGAARLVIDSMGALYSQYTDRHLVRQTLGRLMMAVRRLAVTTLVTAERSETYGDVSRFGVEEFVADAVIVLRNAMDSDMRRRTMEVLKMRGTSHQKGEYPFTISSEAEGVSVVPLSAIELNQQSSTERASLGVPELDRMCAGGLLLCSMTLISGPTGTGKSLIANHFLTGNPEERAAFLAFEEGAEQLRRNGEGWGLPFRAMEQKGTLKIRATYPETANLEDHLIAIKKLLDDFQPKRVVLDSLSALKRIGSDRSFREFLIALVAYLRESGCTALMTNNTSKLEGGNTASEAQISSMTDTIILLRYAEQNASLKRGITVLKMRGSDQDKAIREFSISDRGIEIGEPMQMGGPTTLNELGYSGPSGTL